MANETTQDYVSGEGAIFAQPDGLNSAMVFLGCHDVGDIEEPLGDVNLLLCKDPSGPNRWRTSRITRNAFGLLATSITTNVDKIPDVMEDLPENTPIYIVKSGAGKQSTFVNYDRVFAAKWIVNNRGLTNLAMGRSDSNDRSEQTFDLNGAAPLQRFFDLQNRHQRVSITEVNALNGLAFADEDATEGYASCDPAAAATANLLVRNTSTGAWAAAAADPFDADEVMLGPIVFAVSKSTNRVMVFRGTTDAGNPAEIAYSDDDGATWSTVDVGSTNGEYITSFNMVDENNIWVGTDGGRIYYSDDSGATWTVQENAVITTDAIHDILMADATTGMAVSDSDVVMKTLDGGLTWSQVTATSGGNNLLKVGYSVDFWWVADSGGDLYYSDDEGLTWTVRGLNAGTPKRLKWGNEFFGVLVSDVSGVGQVRVTVNGGETWQSLTWPTNTGLNDVWIKSAKELWFVGEVQGGTGMLFKISI
jgi:hypothetical protein